MDLSKTVDNFNQLHSILIVLSRSSPHRSQVEFRQEVLVRRRRRNGSNEHADRRLGRIHHSGHLRRGPEETKVGGFLSNFRGKGVFANYNITAWFDLLRMKTTLIFIIRDIGLSLSLKQT